MPSVTLHMVLADRVLERWLDDPTCAPFDPSEQTFVNAFYQGAFGPDLGYFPGGQRFLSDLSHLVRSGKLTRTLFQAARTPLERAFASGWLTHVLADKEIHPLVGRGVGEFLYGDRFVFADGSVHQGAHVQVETGLDAFYSHLFPGIRRRRMAPVFDGASIGFLVGAYRHTYEVDFDPTVFMSSHLATVRMSVQGLVSIGVMSTALMTEPLSPTFAGARWFIQRALSLLKSGLMKDSLLLAFLNPLPPTTWLVEQVGKVVDGFADIFFRHFDEGARGLADFNLDSGRVDDFPTTHFGTLRTLEALALWEGRALPGEWSDGGSGGSRGLPAGTHG